MLYSFFWVFPRSLKFICWRFGTLCPIFIGYVSRENNWNEFVYLYWKRSGLKIAWANRKEVDGEGACPSIETCWGGQEPQVEARESMWERSESCKPLLHTHFKKRDSHLKHYSLMSTTPFHPFRASTQHLFSLTYLLCPPLQNLTHPSLFLYSDTPPPRQPPSDWPSYFPAPPFSVQKTPKIWSWFFYLLTPPMKMEQSNPKRRRIKFRPGESPNRKNTTAETYFLTAQNIIKLQKYIFSIEF